MVIFGKCESWAIKRDHDQCCKHLSALNALYLSLPEMSGTIVKDCILIIKKLYVVTNKVV